MQTSGYLLSFLPSPAVMLSGGGEEFRGFLVQARVVADESPAGSFSDFTHNSEESLCTPYEVRR